MPIEFDPKQQVFHLYTDGMSYVIGLIKDIYLAHYYWGARILTVHAASKWRFGQRPNTPTPEYPDLTLHLDTLPQEYPTHGRGDYRPPALGLTVLEDGVSALKLAYRGHCIERGKRPLSGLPAAFVTDEAQATTLTVELGDEAVGLSVELSYALFERFNLVARSAKIVNAGTRRLAVETAMSASVDLPHDAYDILHLWGAPLRERMVERQPLAPGTFRFGSTRGASSHYHNPFFALLRRDATEDTGDVYGFSLVYSGNFLAQTHVDHDLSVRAMIGIHPFQFRWILEPGETFQTPEALLAYSGEGLGGLSRMLHRFIRQHVMRHPFGVTERPILLNSWEAMYFSISEDRLLALAERAAEAGMELFVIDDGWFGERNDDTRALGDWTVNREKFPSGFAALAEAFRSKGLKLGLWIEPEMISPESALYREHPDWVLRTPYREPVRSRHQWVLDLSREEVVAHLMGVIDALLASAPIAYVKWDFNRYLTDVWSRALSAERQQEVAHRYMLGLYRLLAHVTERHPHVLIEGCAGGGGRFDLGMLQFMPQMWTSDNSDAASRIFIQYGTSICYPAIAMGAHVSSVPNHQIGRVTPLGFRAHVAMSGNLGYELDLTALNASERAAIREQVRLYQEIRPIVQFGDFYRLVDPFVTRDRASWMFVDEARREAVVFYFQILAEPNSPVRRLKLKGLDPQALYEAPELGFVMSGAEWMHAGFALPTLASDHQSLLIRLKQVP